MLASSAGFFSPAAAGTFRFYWYRFFARRAKHDNRTEKVLRTLRFTVYSTVNWPSCATAADQRLALRTEVAQADAQVVDAGRQVGR